MKQTTFTFTVDFVSDEPLASYDALLQILREVKGVEAVESKDMTEQCPIAHLSIRVSYETLNQLSRLFSKLDRLIVAHPQTHRLSRGSTPSDYAPSRADPHA